MEIAKDQSLARTLHIIPELFRVSYLNGPFDLITGLLNPLFRSWLKHTSDIDMMNRKPNQKLHYSGH